MKFCPRCLKTYSTGYNLCPQDGQYLQMKDSSVTNLFNHLVDGRYRIVRLIGRGGMGVVYEAVHTAMNRRVAIKILDPCFVSNPVAMERFRREALASGLIKHPNAITIYDYGITTKNEAFIVMEFIEGYNLNVEMRKLGQLDIRRVAWILSEASDAVHAAHKAGIIHRDLKPANIMIETLRTKELVKVLDFGIAKLTTDSDQHLSGLTGTGLLGTPQYMSPEQCQTHDVDERTDIYSLGIIAYEMLTGVLPFSERTPLATVMAQVKEQPSRLSVHRADIPETVEAIVLRALEKDPTQRQQTAEELAESFRELLIEPVGFSTSKQEIDASLNIESFEEVNDFLLLKDLIHYFSKAEKWQEAICYAMRAGNLKFEKNEMAEAKKYYELAIEFSKHFDLEQLKAELSNDNLASCYLNYCFLLMEYFDTVQIGPYLDDALDICHRTNSNLIGWANTLLGYFYCKLGFLDQAMKFVMVGLRKSKSSNDQFSEGIALLIAGDIHLIQKNYQMALSFLNKALKLAEKVDNKNIYTFTLSRLSKFNLKRGKYSQALAFANKLLITAQVTKNQFEECHSLNLLGLANLQLGQIKQADEHCKNAKQVSLLSNYIVGQAESLACKAYTLTHDENNHLIDIEKDCIEKLASLNKIGSQLVEGRLLLCLASIRQRQKDSSATREMLEKAMMIAWETGNQALEVEVLYFLGDMYRYWGKTIDAITILSCAAELAQNLEIPHISWCVEYSLALCKYSEGDLKQAKVHLTNSTKIIDLLCIDVPEEYMDGFMADKKQIYSLLTDESNRTVDIVKTSMIDDMHINKTAVAFATGGKIVVR